MCVQVHEYVMYEWVCERVLVYVFALFYTRWSVPALGVTFEQ